jgi:hypothetical protein
LVAELGSASSLFPSSSQFCEEDGRERKVRVFKNQCALPQERMRAEKKGEESWSRLFVLYVEERNPHTPYLAATVDARRECGFANSAKAKAR